MDIQGGNTGEGLISGFGFASTHGFAAESTFKIWFITSTMSFILPVNPTELTIQYPGETTTYNVVGLGEVIIPRPPKLRQVSIESFFPKAGDYYQTYLNDTSFYSPEDYIDIFTGLQKRREVFRLVVTRGAGDKPAPDLNMTAVIQDFSTTDKGGEPDDLYFSVSITEWRNPAPERLEVLDPGEEDENGRTVRPMKLVSVKQRPIPSDEVCTGQEVQVSGKVYQGEFTLDSAWDLSRRVLSNANCIVTRVVPKVAGLFGLSMEGNTALASAKRVFIKGEGWVNKADCHMGNTNNLVSLTSGNSMDGWITTGVNYFGG